MWFLLGLVYILVSIPTNSEAYDQLKDEQATLVRPELGDARNVSKLYSTRLSSVGPNLNILSRLNNNMM